MCSTKVFVANCGNPGVTLGKNWATVDSSEHQKYKDEKGIASETLSKDTVSHSTDINGALAIASMTVKLHVL